MVRVVLLALALLTASSAAAQEPPPDGAIEMPAGVAQEQIAVTSDYRGSSITVFGVNPDRFGRGDVVVVVRGPSERATVMRKRRVLGLWVNGDPVRFSQAPSFFAVLSTRPVAEIASLQSIWRYQLDPAASAQLESAVPAGADPSAYRAALVRLRRAQGLYQTHIGEATPRRPGGITTYDRGLFSATIRLPANAPIDLYHADAYVFRDGRLISSQRIPIRVERVGIERRIHDLANNAAFLYGVLTVLMALGAGWIAAFLFRRT